MYFYVKFYSKDDLDKQWRSITNKYFEQVTKTFSGYLNINDEDIEGAIGFLVGNNYSEDNCFSLTINNYNSNENSISFNYKIKDFLDISNKFISDSLYKYSKQSDLLNQEFKYCPDLFILDKEDFDSIRKGSPNIKKNLSNSAKINLYKQQNKWVEICNLYEPLDKITDNNEIWDNANDLYDVAYACSKLGEPKNGMEKDRNHLTTVKRYRDLSLKLFKRCYEIEPSNYRFPSAVAYRYYQNVLELSKPKGRRDGKIADEISNAILWFDEALKINPNSIKDNYRKGYIILDKKIDNFKFTPTDVWTSDIFTEINDMEQTAISCFDKVIALYENLNSESDRKYYRNEYVKTLYQLGKYNISKPQDVWNEYACCKIQGIDYKYRASQEDITYYNKGKELFEKCFYVESEYSLEGEIDFSKLARETTDWKISPIEKLYRLGLANLYLYFHKIALDNNKDDLMMYSEKAARYLKAAIAINDIQKRANIGGKNTWYISEKLSRYYILAGDYNKAIQLTERSREGYIMNTYAIALILSDLPDKLNKAENILIKAANDKYNKASDISCAFLAHLYKSSGQQEKFESLINNRDISKSAKSLFL